MLAAETNANIQISVCWQSGSLFLDHCGRQNSPGAPGLLPHVVHVQHSPWTHFCDEVMLHVKVAYEREIIWGRVCPNEVSL